MGFDYANDPKERYPIVKWDIILNIVVISFGLWFTLRWYFQVLGVLLFIQAYVASYFIFHYWKIWVPLILCSIAGFFWVAYFFFAPILVIEAANALLFISIAVTVYAGFSFVIWQKNKKLYRIAQRPEVCLVCGLERKKHVYHMGQRMCVQCFEKLATTLVEYYGSIMFQWDFDILAYLEQELGRPVPLLDPVLNYTNPQDINPDDYFGYVLEGNNITRLYLNNQNLHSLPPFIGLLLYLVELHVKNNQIVALPPSIIDLVNLKIIDFRENPLEFRSGDVERALLNLTRKRCLILED
ncbi:MAG: hypothetical protein ACTSYI_04770 [Promethearchaeota archaeon]